ncbi:MAG: acyl-ACP--UDP-N-acetylglucosamine O-acyltransferase [Phycisphaerales bacterium]|nr:acyl-ACP--UDP-N-acetylglucosamine O-acyltransferase [Phycisphaerales bacterium]
MPLTSPSASIHPTAEVSPEAELGEGVEIGPYCFVKGRVRLGAGVKLLGNNYIAGDVGPVEIGARTVIYPFACIGYEPQDFKFLGAGMKSAGVKIGTDCLIREHATVHAASHDAPAHPTTIGNKVFLMVATHIAHDCIIGNNVVMVNGAGVAGHSVLGDNVTLGGNAVIHQFVRIGRMVMMSGDCAVSLDVPPFCMVNERNRIGGLNTVGLRRGGMDRGDITRLRRAFRDFLRDPLPRKAVIEGLTERGREDGGCAPVAEMAAFIAASTRGICPGMGKGVRGAGTRGAGGDEDQGE